MQREVHTRAQVKRPSGKPENRKNLIYETTAIKLLEISREKFKKLRLKPAKEVPNPNYRSGPPSRLYDRVKIEKLIDNPRVVSLRPKPRLPVDYAGQFEKKYSNAEAAVPYAAQAMFNLNRYAKHDSCANWNRKEIYQLKGKFIKLLYSHGYCEEVYRHHLSAGTKECWYCDGFGCASCKYRGDYLQKERSFLVFRFYIEEDIYSWHYPEDLIDFEVAEATKTRELNATEVKPLEISRQKLAGAKALVRWVTDN